MMKIKAKTSAKQKDRIILGLSLRPELAREVKADAAKRGITIRSLFEELWATYKKKG